MPDEMESLYSELFEAAAVARAYGDELAALADQTQSRWQALWTIESAPLSGPQIARRLGVSRQHMLRLTSELADEGLVELTANPDHKTSPLIRLTEAGQAVLRSINSAASASNQEVMASLTPAKIAELRGLLRQLTRLIKATEVR